MVSIIPNAMLASGHPLTWPSHTQTPKQREYAQNKIYLTQALDGEEGTALFDVPRWLGSKNWIEFFGIQRNPANAQYMWDIAITEAVDAQMIPLPIADDAHEDQMNFYGKSMFIQTLCYRFDKFLYGIKSSTRDSKYYWADLIPFSNKTNLIGTSPKEIWNDFKISLPKHWSHAGVSKKLRLKKDKPPSSDNRRRLLKYLSVTAISIL